MDYNQFDWVVIRPHPAFLTATFKHLIGLVPLAAILIGGSYLLAKAMTELPFGPLWGFFIILDLFGLATVNGFWIHLERQTTPSITTCKLDETGVKVANQTTPLSDFDPTALRPLLTKQALPYSSWQKTNPTGEVLSLIVPSKHGPINLYFSHQYDRQKFIQSFLAHFS